MPFLEGVPCSIHGFVLPDGVAVLRPVEQVVLRRPGTARFSIRRAVHLVGPSPQPTGTRCEAPPAGWGELLGDQYGMRGGFAIDGVLTAEGFLPTELNPRFSGGLGISPRASPGCRSSWPRWQRPASSTSASPPPSSRALIVAADRPLPVRRPRVTGDVGRPQPWWWRCPAARTDHRRRRSTVTRYRSVELGPARWGSLVSFRPAEWSPARGCADHAVAALASPTSGGAPASVRWRSSPTCVAR